jgi:phosphate transport system substrate-binding protein
VKVKFLAVAGLLAISAVAATAQNINGAGATFPYPIYSRWFSEYAKAHPEVKINYQSIGSGGGIRQVSEGTVDFGATDSPMTDEASASAKVKTMHIPTVLGAVVPVYNLKGVSQTLNFSGDVIADIYLGKISKWSDARIKKDNPGVNFPDSAILPVYRSDGSGTSFIFTDYLSKVSGDFKTKVGAAASVKWPTGIGQKGNEGVAGMVRQSPNSFGYVELIYARGNNMQFGSVKNASGKFVQASTDSVSAAAAGATIPKDYRVSITNAPGANAYPISSFTWLLIPTQFTDGAKAKAMKEFLGWMLSTGEGEASGMTYAPLPTAVSERVKQTIATIH